MVQTSKIQDDRVTESLCREGKTPDGRSMSDPKPI